MSRPRRHHPDRCPCGKTAFRTWEVAAKMAARLPVPGRVYFCPEGGYYHFSRAPKPAMLPSR